MKKLKKFLPIILLISLMAISSFFVDQNSILESKELLVNFAQENIFLASFAYILIYATCVALSLPIATILTLLAGIVFAPFLGTVIVVTGATIGAIVIFMVVKTTSNNLNIIQQAQKSKHLLTLQKNLQKNAVSYMLFARLVPIFPFVLVNIAPATVGIKLSTFVWTTFIGIIPGSFIYTYLGYQSGQLESVADLVSTEMILALVLLGLFSLTPMLYKKIRNK